MDQHASTIPQRRTDVAAKLAGDLAEDFEELSREINQAPVDALPAIMAAMLRVRSTLANIRELVQGKES